MTLSAGPAEPLYLRIAQSFEDQIENRSLAVGDRLPSVRELSRRLGISAGTAVAAYEWLERQGVVVARPRSGFYVAGRPPNVPEPTVATRVLAPTRVSLAELILEIQSNAHRADLFPFGEAVIDPDLLPSKRFGTAVRRSTSAYLQHTARSQEPAGNARLRRQIARLAYRLSLVAAPDDIIVTNGALEALSLAMQSVTRPGDIVAVESPGCFEKFQLLETLGLRALEIPVRPRHGPNLSLMSRSFREHGVKALMMSACCHSPLGTELSDSTKAEIVALAERVGVPIIENDCFGDLSFSARRPRPFKAFDTTGSVLYCGSLSQLVAPEFPFGWVDAGRFRGEVEALKAIASAPVATLPQLAFADFLEAGAYERHLRKLVRVLAHSTRALATAIAERFPPGTRLVQPDGGFFVWVQLPERLSGQDIYREALTERVAIVPGIAFSAHRQFEDCIRLTCGWAWSERAEHAVDRLAALVTRRAREARAAS